MSVGDLKPVKMGCWMWSNAKPFDISKDSTFNFMAETKSRSTIRGIVLESFQGPRQNSETPSVRFMRERVGRFDSGEGMVLLKKLPAHLTSLSPTLDAVGVSSKHPAGALPARNSGISDFLADRGRITLLLSSSSPYELRYECLDHDTN
ncbi:hypothetical protein HZH66_012231 [Vespula vulgaris]|uniref:Uncharacterized protein n=2 Tax=Vespula TaxID=7451 RepID=A0A834MUP2_VESVU|nr:hypothetical protein HZH66_012231 [Vespula vulgaris]